MDLGVGLLEADVGEPVGPRPFPDVVEHLRGQVDAQGGARCGQATDVARRLPGATADVEHGVVIVEAYGVEEPAPVPPARPFVAQGLLPAGAAGLPPGR